MVRVLGLVALLAAVMVVHPASAWVNTNIKRRLHLQSHVVRERVEYTVENDGDAAADAFVVAFADDVAPHIALVRGELNKERIPLTKTGSSNGHTLYELKFPTPVPAGESVTFRVATYFTHALTSFPTEMSQSDPHLVVFKGNHFVPSPYTTTKQQTTVRLPTSQSGGLEDYSEETPVKADGDSVKYGPYHNKPAFSVSPMRLHFATSAVFATLTSVDKEIEVSHWGNVAVEEQYDLLNSAAQLKGGFARIDYQMRLAQSASFRMLTAHLPLHATDLYYRDIIGNISTSYVREGENSLDMEIETRFPMFGGWRTQWYQGYNLPASHHLTVDGSMYTLTVDFGVPFDNVVTNELLVKVVLPEGADVQSVKAPVDVEHLPDSRRFTYLDASFLGGRPVLAMKARNLIDKNNGPVVVSYTMPANAMMREPLLMVTAFFTLFLTYSVVSRLQFSLA